MASGRHLQRSGRDPAGSYPDDGGLLYDYLSLHPDVYCLLLSFQLILAIYYTFADIVLLIQCFYYRAYARTPESEPEPQTNGNGTTASASARPSTADSEHAHHTEESPLLSRTISDYYGETRRRSSLSILAEHAHHLSPANPLHSLPPSRPDSPAKNYTNGEYPIGYDGASSSQQTLRDTDSSDLSRRKLWKAIVRNTIAVSLVVFAGIAGYYLSPPTPKSPKNHEPLEFSYWGQIFGYLCAILYLGSRIPQIVLNYQRKSCEGVAFLFFLFACLGNVTYVISIMAYEPGKAEDGDGYWRYIALNASWLLGSVGTLALDFVIFIQFFMYRKEEDYYDDSAVMSDEDE
ncbi:hypothetical protein AA313_de0209447 [Arthrobotrys entomopaga]|nr:hypothetical protein AA313_de0209447 [Arthrobotrys entomopaga]